MNVRLDAADTIFHFHIPSRVRVRYALRIVLAVYQKADPITDLRDRSMRAKIPDRCREHIPTGVKKRGEIVRFVSPVCQVAAARTATHSLPICMQDELIVGAHVDIEMLRSLV